MAKKENYYVTIKGRKYDRELIQLAEEFTSGKRDGRISVSDAKQLLKAVKDNNSYTDIEKHTIEHIRENYKFTEKADEWFRTEIRKWAAKRVQDSKKKSEKSLTVNVPEEESPEANFPSSWGEDVGTPQESPAREYTNYIPTPSAKPHLKKDKTVPILIFLAGLLILTGLIYFLWSLFSSEKKQNPIEVAKTVEEKVPPKKKDVGTPKENEVEKKSSFSWFGKENGEEFSSNPKFKAIETNAIRFEKNSIQVHKESRPSLNQLSRWMREDPKIRVKIIGHTSLEGTEAVNQKVSSLRAEMVRDYLVGNGVSSDRFEIIPKGASVPIGDNSKEEGKEKNRRVELRIRN